MMNERVKEFIEENFIGDFVLNKEEVINEIELMELVAGADAVIRTIVDNALVICRAEAIDIVEHL